MPNDPSLVCSVVVRPVFNVKTRSGATSEMAKPCVFVPSHDGCGFDLTSRTDRSG